MFADSRHERTTHESGHPTDVVEFVSVLEIADHELWFASRGTEEVVRIGAAILGVRRGDQFAQCADHTGGGVAIVFRSEGEQVVVQLPILGEDVR